MIEPRDPELDAFVELLRSATPRPEELAVARAGVLAKAASPLGAAASILIKLGLIAVVLVAGAPPRDPPPDLPPFRGEEIARVGPPPPDLPPLRGEERASADALPAPSPATRGRAGVGVRHRSPPREEPVRIEPPPAPLAPTAPSATLLEARRDVDARRWARAAGELQEVVDGRSGDSPESIAQAELLLAKSLFALGLDHAASAAFAPIAAAGPAHPWFDESLPMIAELAVRAPEPSSVARQLEAYEPDALTALPPDRRVEVAFVLGRQRAAEGRDAEALAALGGVPLAGAHGPEARFLEGVIHARRGRARPALRAFAQVANETDPGTALHELAWINLARVRYALAARASDAGAREAGLAQALAAWGRVPEDSPRWAEAFGEETWALYLAGDVERALGHAHALGAPALAERADPDAQIVRAMIQLEHCQWDAAERSVAAFGALVAPRLADLAATERLAASPRDALRVLVAVRAGRSRVPPRVEPLVRDALADRELDRHLAQVRSIEAEARRVPGLLTGDVATRVTSELAVSRGAAIERVAERVRRRLARLRAELEERSSRMDTIELEITTARRRELGGPRARMEPAEGGPVVGYSEGQRWPFDGEFWPDELPHYRQSIERRCR